jgi:hypothetical protein
MTSEQLYSTASYKRQDLRAIIFQPNDLTGWDLRGQDLRDADFGSVGYSVFSDSFAILTGVDASGADLRGAAFPGLEGGGYIFWPDAFDEIVLSNTILPDGQIDGLHLAAGEQLVIRDDQRRVPDYSRRPAAIPVFVVEEMSISPEASLDLVFEDTEWGSTISFEPGINVGLDGFLKLRFGDGVDPRSLVGTTFALFNWEGVVPTGSFEVVTDPGAIWNTTDLYATGEVTLLAAVPEPATVGLLVFALGFAASHRIK